MRRLAVALVVAAILAGCADGDGGGGASPSPSSTGSSSSSQTTTGPPPPSPPVLQLLVFELNGCAGVSVQHARPIEDVQGLLPDGFTAAPAAGGNEATGMLAVDLYKCASLTTATATVPDTYIGFVYTYVERPVERVPGAPDVPGQEYVFRMLAGEDVLAQLWKAAMYDTFNGTGVMDVFEGTGPARVSNGGIGEIGAGYSVYATGAGVDALGGDRDQAFARYTVVAADNSILMWTGTYDLPAVAIGGGAFEVVADDPFAPLAPPARRLFSGSAVQVADGAVHGQVLSRVFTPA